jgi:hypothetical protein
MLWVTPFLVLPENGEDVCGCDQIMPSKDYRIWLSDTAYIVVDLMMLRGQIVSFVARLMLLQPGGMEVNVARYDTAHGAPHLDVLGKRRGLLVKTWYFNARMDAVLNRAIDDFKTHYEIYIRNYMQN